MQFSTKIVLVAVIAVVAGPFLTYNGYREKQRLADLEKNGVTVPGVIEGGEWSKGGRRRSSSYSFDVAFQPKDGGPVTKSFKVNANYFATHANEKESVITDENVKVRYLAGDVEKSAILEGGSTDDTLMFPFGIGAFSLGSLALLGMMMAKRK